MGGRPTRDAKSALDSSRSAAWPGDVDLAFAGASMESNRCRGLTELVGRSGALPLPSPCGQPFVKPVAAAGEIDAAKTARQTDTLATWARAFRSQNIIMETSIYMVAYATTHQKNRAYPYS